MGTCVRYRSPHLFRTLRAHWNCFAKAGLDKSYMVQRPRASGVTVVARSRRQSCRGNAEENAFSCERCCFHAQHSAKRKLWVESRLPFGESMLRVINAKCRTRGISVLQQTLTLPRVASGQGSGYSAIFRILQPLHGPTVAWYS